MYLVNEEITSERLFHLRNTCSWCLWESMENNKYFNQICQNSDICTTNCWQSANFDPILTNVDQKTDYGECLLSASVVCSSPQLLSPSGLNWFSFTASPLYGIRNTRASKQSKCKQNTPLTAERHWQWQSQCKRNVHIKGGCAPQQKEQQNCSYWGYKRYVRLVGCVHKSSSSTDP